MKRVFVFFTVMALAATLLGGCSTSGVSSENPGEKITGATPVPGSESPETGPKATTPSPALEPGQTTQFPSAGSPTGTLTFFVTDAPGYKVDRVVVRFCKVEVHRASDGDHLTTNSSVAGWIPVELYQVEDEDGDYLSINGTVDEGDDYLTCNSTKEITLSEDMGYVKLAQGKVPAGRYTQIRIHMADEGVEVFYWELDDDGNTVGNLLSTGAKLPNGILKFVRSFEVLPAADDGQGEGEGEAGAGASITLDFDLQNSVVWPGAFSKGTGQDKLPIVKPVVKLDVTLPEGDAGDGGNAG